MLNKTLKLNPKLFKDDIEQVPTRFGYGEGLIIAGRENPNVVALCADLTDSTRTSVFKKEFPDRFVEMGITEQNMASLASGMAAVGKVPFISSYAMFSPGRNWEQIRTTICYNNQNVKIAGAHSGVSVGPDGATHQMLEDIALMRALPNMIVVVPADYEQTKKATKAIAAYQGPSYMRFAREKTEQLTTLKTPFEIGKAQILKEGEDVAIIGAGPLLYECLLAAGLLQERGVHAMVINCHTIKPLDKTTILNAARKCKRVVTVEEAQITGGLGGAIAELLAEEQPTKLKRIGVLDRFGESGEPEELVKKFGLSSETIFKEAYKLVRG